MGGAGDLTEVEQQLLMAAAVHGMGPVLADVRRHASLLGACAREIEERAYDR